MMVAPTNAVREIGISVDLDALGRAYHQQQQDTQEREAEQAPEPFISVLAAGTSPQVLTPPTVPAPALEKLFLLLNAHSNPYVELHWTVDRQRLERSQVAGFRVWRRRILQEALSREQMFSQADFDKSARKTPGHSRFSPERAGIHKVKKGAIPGFVLRPLSHEESAQARARIPSQSVAPSAGDLPGIPHRAGAGTSSAVDYKFVEVAYVCRAAQLSLARERAAFRVERGLAEFSYRDDTVALGEEYEYSVETVASSSLETAESNVLRVFIRDYFSQPERPTLRLFVADQGASVVLSVNTKYRDNVTKLHIYRRESEELNFQKLAQVSCSGQDYAYTDKTVSYGKRYLYRVFSENFNRRKSAPGEIDAVVTSSIVGRSPSNTLADPLFFATQRQGATDAKILILPNDVRVLYYQIDRKNLSRRDRVFSVPQFLYLHSLPRTQKTFGGGWPTNKFFVQKDWAQDAQMIRSVSMKNIEFVDEFVEVGQIYEYRIRGFDAFGNQTSCAFQKIRIVKASQLRRPVNLAARLLSGNRIGVQLSWRDDNVNKLGAATAEQATYYELQRRAKGSTFYSSFALVSAPSLVDEEAPDAGSSREFDLPPYLEREKTYFYRVRALRGPSAGRFDQASVFTDEVEVKTYPPLNPPYAVTASLIGDRQYPRVAVLRWQSALVAGPNPDHWVVERRVDIPTDAFKPLSSAFDVEFFDTSLEPGQKYVYRIAAVDTLGRTSRSGQTRVSA